MTKKDRDFNDTERSNMENEHSKKNQAVTPRLIDLVFSWSLQDLLNHQLHKTQVQEIPVSFSSEHQYLESIKLLLEETRAELSSNLECVSRAPYGRIESILEIKRHIKSWAYKLKVNHWRNTSNGVYGNGSSYKVLPGHVFVFTDEKPESISDLEAVLGRKWSLAMAETIEEDGVSFEVEASYPCGVGENDVIGKPLYLVFLMNIKTNERIWNALHMKDNMSTMREVSAKSCLVRTLFERFSKMDGVPKHVLNMQYRIDPSISSFPNSTFYGNQILDAPNVGKKDCSKLNLPGPLLGYFSFINISCGKEEMDAVQNSRKSMLEVAVVTKIVRDLFEAWKELKQQISIVVTSPYTAQVLELRKRLERKYRNFDGFKLQVRPIDMLQGQEQDIIILSTVRSESDSSIGLDSDLQRTNVASIRARQGLWILGNERALCESESFWKYIVSDAKDRRCFFNADEDEYLAKFIMEVKKEMDQFDEILDSDNFVFGNARWEVLFSQNFKNSFEKIKSLQMRKLVIYLLGMLACGWRPKKRNINIICDQSKQILKKFKVKDLYIVCSVDVVQKTRYIQVLKVWDILPLVDIPELVERLDTIFCTYTDDFLRRCKAKCLEGDLEVPMGWETSYDVVRHKKSSHVEEGVGSNTGGLDITSSSSLLLMKFYALSSGIASHLLSGCDGEEIEFPFELSNQEMEVVHFNRSSFVLGRSGTGKTTVLIRKLIQREQLHHIALEGFHGQHMEDGESSEETKGPLLRQIFVTLSSRLCYAVKQNVSGLKRFLCNGNTSNECVTAHLDATDGMQQFTDIPDSLVDLPPKFYPLVITFHKFLMMLNGTVGSSFFNRFPEARSFSHGNRRNSMSLALRTFIGMNEVNFDKFKSSYWPHFNVNFTKSLESSVVFSEIMSHIKGGSQAGVATDGKLSQNDYISLSRSRVSRLSTQEKEIIYDIFLQYEKRKTENGEYDMADLVIDLHRRLRENKYEGDIFDFVYIDEVQDFSMRQIALFKYVCRNVNDGFVFSGDTAQTIARGIDFRFQDIRSTFYKEFVTIPSCDKTYKKSKHVQIADTFHLSQNFRTHAGILKLAQSIINLIYHFFPLSIDILKPEASFTNGKTPVLVESVNFEKAFTNMFGGFGGAENNLVGFGAEQVILVRDENIRNKICDSVARHALVLTIMECKGLEFQDVLLYDFLGSSPLKNEWRVIYEYMNENNLLGPGSPKSFPSFNDAKHKLLRFELKQLYVAITRTRQRLWIFENIEDHSKPVLDYWKKLKVVQVGEFDDSLVKEIQLTSSKEEWNSRAVKLFYENNYKSAKMCFQRAGNTFYVKWAEASSLQADARHISGSRSKKAHEYLKKAAELFDSIGKYESAAQCYYEKNDYEKAGTIYLEKCGDSKLEEAGECFTRARCYDRAAFAYAKGKLYSNCIAACIQGKLFHEGLYYINLRRTEVSMNNRMKRYCHEIEAKEQNLLEFAALSYKNLKDNSTMMKFVRAFTSRDLMRSFLSNNDYLDELMQLESEWGNFLNASRVAKQMGNLLLEAELLEKAGDFKEASSVILLHVFANSLWAEGNNGWPMKHFTRRMELFDKAKELAKNVSGNFFKFVCSEEYIFSDQQIPLAVLMLRFSTYLRQENVRGKVLCARKILDGHICFCASKYLCSSCFRMDQTKHACDILSKNQVSIDTLIYFWNLWLQYIEGILQYLRCLENQSVLGEFCLNYLGVRKKVSNGKDSYLVFCSDAHWVKAKDNPNLKQKGKLISLKPCQFANAALKYWSSEMISVGMKVLEKLITLYEFPPHHRNSTLIHILKVLNSLMELDFLRHIYKIEDYFHRFIASIFGTIFPLDWRESSVKNMINLRERREFRDFFRNIFNMYIGMKSQLTHDQVGNLVMTIIGASGELSCELYEQTTESRSLWRLCIKSLVKNLRPESQLGSSLMSFNLLQHVSLVNKVLEAQKDYCFSDWKSMNVSPGCFLYLVDRLLIMVFCCSSCFFCSESTVLEWLIHHDSKRKISHVLFDWQSNFAGVLDSLSTIVEEFLCNEQDVIKWIKSCKLSSECHSGLVLRLFVVLCLLCVNSGNYFDLLLKLLGNTKISSKLPSEFCTSIGRLKPAYVSDNINIIAEAFEKIGNPLVILKSGNDSLEFECPDAATFVDLMSTHGRDKLDEN